MVLLNSFAGNRYMCILEMVKTCSDSWLCKFQLFSDGVLSTVGIHVGVFRHSFWQLRTLIMTNY